MTVKEIVDQLEVLAPPALAESWDNPGLLVGRWNRGSVTGVCGPWMPLKALLRAP